MAAQANLARPLRDVFNEIAREASLAEALMLQTENALAPLVAEGANEHGVTENLQRLDLAIQTLRNLASFASTLATTTAAHGAISITSALEAVSLSDMQARLAGRKDSPDDSGAVELF